MELRDLMKEWRIWVLVIALVTSLALLGPSYVQDDQGEWQITTDIQKGLDLEGGVRVLLSIEDEEADEELAENIRNILETRVNAFGLTQADVRTVRLADEFLIQVQVADTNETQLRNLLEREGSFQSRMPLPVHEGEERQFELHETYTFEKVEGGVRVDGETYSEGDIWELDGTEFNFRNDTEDTAHIEVVAYTGQDVQSVLESDSLVRQQGDGYTFRFPVVISREAAENVQRVSQNYEVIPSAQGSHLGIDGDYAMLALYVDGQQMSELRVAGSFRRDIITQPSITGSGATAEEARANMNELISILQSGQLPASLNIESISTVSSSLGDEFWQAALISIGAALIAVGVLVYIRYGSIKVAAPIFFTGSCEVFIITGSWFTTMATLDLASIAGIIAAVGTGVDDQIIIADESGREKVRSWKKRMKRAFFVIFTSAASTIGAMMPLISPELTYLAIGAAGLGLIGYSTTKRRGKHYFALGVLAVGVSAVIGMLEPSGFALQSVQGFAVTTILGVTIGISITRPAYAKILEFLRD